MFAAVAVPLLAGFAAAEPGFVEIDTIPGVTVKIDGKFAGVTEREETLVVRDVAAGAHRIDAWINGYEDQHDVIVVEPGAVTRVKLRVWLPISEERVVELQGGGDPVKAGALRVDALPKTEATIEAKKLGWIKLPLGSELFAGTHVPAGVQRLKICNPDKCIDYKATIRADETTSLIVDFPAGKVRDVSATRNAELARDRERCDAGDRAACVDPCRNDLLASYEKGSRACELLLGELAKPIALEKR